LRHSEERLRLIVENARDFAIFATDMERRVTSWNSGAERILGYAEAEIVGQSADIIFTPEDRAAGACEREAQTALAEGRANDERWHIRKDGIRFWGSGVMTAMHGPAGEALGFVKVLRDQTEAKRAQEALSQSQAELEAALRAAEAARQEAEAANRTKDLFLATLSHELRTPLTPIALAVDGLLRRADLPPRFKEALEMISRNVQIEATLVADLLDVTRISRGKLELACSRLDVHEAVRQAVEVVEAEIQAKQQQLTVDLAAERSELEGDFIRLQQAFWNLLKNSSKFTPACGQIRVSSRNEELNWLVIEVVDTGRGVDPAALPHIFEAFRQEERAVTTQFGGLGLGLAITKAIVAGHNGSIAAFSAGRNQGFTCTIKLPLASPRNLS
jgi:two-component system CheB/CheR fusion protein